MFKLLSKTFLQSIALACAMALWPLTIQADSSAQAKVQPSAQQSFTVGKGSFMLNGKPFLVKAAELHYPRIPRPYW